MTPVQWLFHYIEVLQFKSNESETETDITKLVIELFNNQMNSIKDTIFDAAKLTGTMANPEAGKALLDAEKLQEAKADISDDEFADFWSEFSGRIPGELKVEDAGDNVDLEGDAINLEKLYEIEMEARRKYAQNNN